MVVGGLVATNWTVVMIATVMLFLMMVMVAVSMLVGHHCLDTFCQQCHFFNVGFSLATIFVFFCFGICFVLFIIIFCLVIYTCG